MKHGNNLYVIEYLEIVIKEDIPKLPTSARQMIKRTIEERLTVDPIGFGKPLRYSLKGHRRLRAANYRIVYRIDAIRHKVIIITIKHRKEVYSDF